MPRKSSSTTKKSEGGQTEDVTTTSHTTGDESGNTSASKKPSQTVGSENGLTPEPLGTGPTGSTPSGDTASLSPEPPAESDPSQPAGMTEGVDVSGQTEYAGMSRTEMEEVVVRIVRQELAGLMEGFTVREIPKTGRGGGRLAVKKAFSIPADLWQEFERLCPGIASNHVAAALRLYLNLQREKKE